MRDEIKEILTSIVNESEKEIRELKQSDLSNYWFFKWDDEKSVETNMYKFHDLLKLYSWHCRRWEETHNGIVCVVERVRDTYIMPKIKEFKELLKEKLKEE